jgi:phage tail sheath protein FI
MSVTTSYPGIYIQELPSNTHTIASAPTSVTVFVGYTHPFLTPSANFGQALEIFSFSDYERLFGGFYQSSIIDANVSYAVNEFFTNGGTNAFVVGLQPLTYFKADGTSAGTIASTQPTATMFSGGGDGIVFTPLQPTDAIPINVTVNNIQNDAASHPTTADLVVTYGSQTETYRKISLLATINGKSNPNFITTRINGPSNTPGVNGVSQLVAVAPPASPGAYPATFTGTPPFTATLSTTVPTDATNVFNAADFLAVFQEDSSLDKVPIFNLLLTPGVENNAVLSEALAFAERKLAFFIMDPPILDVADGSPGATNTDWVGDFLGNFNGAGDTGGNVAPQSPNGALYFPYLLADNPVTGLPTNAAGGTFTLPPSGYVAGIFAATDASRGVWKAPAGLAATLLDTTGVVPGGVMTDTRQGVLNLIGVNCIRSFPGAGTVVFGARTLVSANTAYQQWMYVPVRRMALFLEQTLKTNLTWVIFEPNDTPLWTAIRISIQGFMLSLYNQGAFAGTTPSDAFQVKCDSTTTTPSDQALGIVNIVVAFAPLRPAEFVVVKIAQLAGQASS